MKTKLATYGLAMILAASDCAQAQTGRTHPITDWREEYAYSVGVQAYVYAFPLLYQTELRHKWATDATSFPYAAPNHSYHFRNIVDAMDQRYFAFELADMYSHNFGYLGKRTTGNKAAAFLIAGPDWERTKTGGRPRGDSFTNSLCHSVWENLRGRSERRSCSRQIAGPIQSGSTQFVEKIWNHATRKPRRLGAPDPR